MATTYSEFSCLGSDLLTNLQTAILASTDWARPNSGTFPTLYKATTTRGAQMVVELNAVALTTTAMTIDFFHSHNGTTGVTASRRYLRIKGLATGTLATNMYHVVVSAGKEHLFIRVEGPKAADSNPDNASYGSSGAYLFMSDLVPYFPGTDTTPTVICGATIVNATNQTYLQLSQVCYATRDGLNLNNMSPGRLAALLPVNQASGEVSNWEGVAVLDSDHLYLSPYVFFDYNEGIRGRLSSFFYAGYTRPTGTDPVSLPPVDHVITYDGIDYKLLTAGRGDANNSSSDGALGGVQGNTTAGYNQAPIVAVPYV